MRALVPLSLALLAAPGTALAAPVAEDVAWLADLAGVAPGDLPAMVPGREGGFGARGLVERGVLVPIAEVAAEARRAQAEGTGEPLFLGAGVRGVTGTVGMSWTGVGVGPAASMDCMSITVQQDLGATPRGTAYLGLRGEVLAEAIGGGSGTARVDMQVYPTQATAGTIAAKPADGLFRRGRLPHHLPRGVLAAYTTGTFGADGTVGGDGA